MKTTDAFPTDDGITTDAKPKICQKCGAEVPPNQLVCTCFQVPLDQEIEKRGLESFANPKGNGASGYLYRTETGHLSPARNTQGVLMLCGKQRYKTNVETSVLDRERFEKIMAGPEWKEELCIGCAQKVTMFLKAAR